MDNFWLVARQVWILFALIGAGALCRRARLLDDASVRGIVNVLVLAVTPCLIVDVFQRPFDPSMLRQLALAFLVSGAVNCALAAASVAIFRRGAAKERSVLRLAMVFSNAGFMGIPLEQAILGDKGVFFGIAYVAMFNLLIWSWGVREMSVGEAPAPGSPAAGTARAALWAKSIVNPGTVGLAAGLPLFLASVRLPEALAAPVGLMASLNTPLAMLAIGYYLAGARLGAAARSPAAYLAMLIRLAACPLALVAAFYPFRAMLDRDMMLALVTAASAPVAAMVTIFSARFGRDVDLSVALVSASTLLSVATMPAVIAFAMAVLGGGAAP